jgi:hypothetical protein
MLNAGLLTHFSLPGKQKGKKEKTKQARKEKDSKASKPRKFPTENPKRGSFRAEHENNFKP